MESVELEGINATVIGVKVKFLHDYVSNFVQWPDTYLETY